MSDNKSKDSSSTGKPSGDSFDDLEDAFFASGDASGFWETADPSQLDDESAEAESPATARDDEAEAWSMRWIPIGSQCCRMQHRSEGCRQQPCAATEPARDGRAFQCRSSSFARQGFFGVEDSIPTPQR